MPPIIHIRRADILQRNLANLLTNSIYSLTLGHTGFLSGACKWV